jgi:hypothetical protein
MTTGRGPRRLLGQCVPDRPQSGQNHNENGEAEGEAGAAAVSHAIPIGQTRG